jgi:hypothetical protein
MAYFKKRSKSPSLGARAIPLGAVVAALGGLLVAYLRWFRPGVAVELTGAEAGGKPAAPTGPGVKALAERFHGLDGQHAATHYPPSLERDPKSIEQAVHEG